MLSFWADFSAGYLKNWKSRWILTKTIFFFDFELEDFSTTFSMGPNVQDFHKPAKLVIIARTKFSISRLGL